MLIALAPPAMRYPPTTTQNSWASDGRPAGVMNIGAMVVTSSSEMMRGLVRVIRSAASEGDSTAIAGAEASDISMTGLPAGALGGAALWWQVYEAAKYRFGMIVHRGADRDSAGIESARVRCGGLRFAGARVVG